MVKTKLGCKTFSQVANFRNRSKFNFVYFFNFNFFARNHFFFIKDKKMHGAGLSSSSEMAPYAPL